MCGGGSCMMAILVAIALMVGGGRWAASGGRRMDGNNVELKLDEKNTTEQPRQSLSDEQGGDGNDVFLTIRILRLCLNPACPDALNRPG